MTLLSSQSNQVRKTYKKNRSKIAFVDDMILYIENSVGYFHVYSVQLPIFNRFLWVVCYWVLHTLDINPLSHVWCANIFFPFHNLHFLLLIVLFALYNLFDLVWLKYLLLLLFVLSLSLIPLLRSVFRWFFPMLTSRSFMISCLKYI